jgi:hypothetical protein
MKTIPVKLDYFDAFSIADVAARTFADDHPRNDKPIAGLTVEVASGLRNMMRHTAVTALRLLWKTGRPEARAIVAERVHLWVFGADECNRRANIRKAIIAREYRPKRKANTCPYCRKAYRTTATWLSHTLHCIA